MLPKENRLTEKSDFQLLFKKGVLFRGSLLNFFYSPSSTVAKFGFVVSNKVSKLAVERNRLKRLLRVQVYLFLRKRPKFRGVGVFVVLKRDLGLLAGGVSADCQKLLERI